MGREDDKGRDAAEQPAGSGEESTRFPDVHSSFARAETQPLGVDLRPDAGESLGSEDAPVAEPGSRYVLEGEVGRGGMGAVLKVFDADLRRSLAMKVVLDGPAATEPQSASSSLALGRFIEEAQVTGQLEHPGIVPVHELGVDSGGQAYFTMRLVRGRDLRRIFERTKGGEGGWTLTRTLGVLLKVCEAMAYAHDKGVVHRDLKPANVMVGKYGEVYVMDWGLARVAGRQDSRDIRLQPESSLSVSVIATDRADHRDSDADSPLLTMDGAVVGTPAYMAPEQARGESENVDARSDVYSVGAMLYHLLARQVPYVPPGVRPSPHGVWRWVLEGPPRPLGELAPDVPAELEAICEKAMAREPGERYADMTALASDLRAYLEGRVVHAYQSGAVAEFKKWVLRNKGMAASIAAAVLLALGGLGATSWTQARANERLTRQAAITYAVNSFLNEDLLAAVAPAAQAGRGRDVKMREVLDAAASRIDDPSRPGGRFAELPQAEAAIRDTLGTTYTKLGEYATGLPHTERALELFRAELGDEHRDTLRTMSNLAIIHASTGRLTEAIELRLRVLEVQRRELGSDHADTLISINNLASSYQETDRYEEAEPLQLEALEGQRQLLGDEHADTLASATNLASLYHDLGRMDEAEALYLETVETARRVQEGHPDTLHAMNNLAKLYEDQGRYEDSLELQVETLAIRRRVEGNDHRHTLSSVGNLALLYQQLGRFDAAEPLFEELVAARRRTLGDDDRMTLSALTRLGDHYRMLGRQNEAEPLFSEVLETCRRTVGDADPRTLNAMQNLAVLYGDLGRFEDAERLGREVLETGAGVVGEGHPSLCVTMTNLAGVLSYQGRFADAEALLTAAVEGFEKGLGAGHEYTLDAQNDLAWLLVSAEPAELRDPERALRIARACNENTPGDVPSYLDTLARAYYLTGDRSRAIEVQERALEGLPAGDSALRRALEESLTEFLDAEDR